MRIVIILLCLFGLAQIPPVKVQLEAALSNTRRFVNKLFSTVSGEERVKPNTVVQSAPRVSAPARPAPVAKPSAQKSYSSVSDELKDKRPFGSDSNTGGSY